jgi:conserved repeat protein
LIRKNIKCGDIVTNIVKIKSLNPDTVLRNVSIEEILPKGLDLKEDTVALSINGNIIQSGLLKTSEGDKTKATIDLTEINRK